MAKSVNEDRANPQIKARNTFIKINVLYWRFCGRARREFVTFYRLSKRLMRHFLR